MKKILIVLDNMKMGGSERQALILARWLRERCEVDIKVIALQSPAGQVAAICDQLRIEWSVLSFTKPRNPLKLVRNLLYVAGAFRREQPYAIIPFGLRANVVCGLIWRITGAKTTIWNQRRENYDVILGRRLDFLAAYFSPMWIANSHQGAVHISKIFQRPLSQIKVINNGVQFIAPIQSRPTWRQSLGISEDCFAACMVANFHAPKDHATLLHAWRIVQDYLAPVGRGSVLVLAGRPSSTYKSMLLLVNELQLTEHVRFLGEVDDIAGLLASVELGVHSSHKEGCPNGLLECMAAGLPVVATDIPGTRFAIGEENENWLVPENDFRKLAQKILAFAADPNLRSTVGKENQDRVLTLFSAQRMCDHFCSIMRISVLNKQQELVQADTSFMIA